jgi:4-oxalocrotonate tautomerase
MPVTRIAVREGKTPEYKRALLDEIYEAMCETVAIKDGDGFMAITEHREHEFAYGPFLGIDRSADLIQIQVAGRSRQARERAWFMWRVRTVVDQRAVQAPPGAERTSV